MGELVILVDSDGFLVPLDGFLEIPQLVMDEAQITQGSNVFGV